MTDATARFALPLLAAGQAQKELFHNEALARIDALVQASAEAVGIDTPPSSPVAGQCWVVGTAPSDDWAGQAGALAVRTEGGWRFIAPRVGMTIWSLADALIVRFDGSAWKIGEIPAERLLVGGVQVVGARRPAIADPAGGTTLDGEARTAISAILAALRTHGLIAS